MCVCVSTENEDDARVADEYFDDITNRHIRRTPLGDA